MNESLPSTRNLRTLVFVDVETTGLDENMHEIIELAVLRVDPVTLEIDKSLVAKVQPQHLDVADPEALAINGYSPELWAGAVTLETALRRARRLMEGCVLAGHNVGAFDKRFLDVAWMETDIEPPTMDHHVVDTATLAWPLVRLGLIPNVSLDTVCEFLGIDSPVRHSALPDAYRCLEVARELLPAVDKGLLMASLPGDARTIAEMSLQRLRKGSEDYGAWDVNDGRDWGMEALEEIADALHYVMAEIIQFRRQRAPGGEGPPGGAAQVFPFLRVLCSLPRDAA